MPDRVPLESEEARTLVAWLRIKGYRFWHTPNETGSDMTSRRRAVRMKREGVSRGVPDYFVLTNAGLMAIELKRVKGSTTSPEQREWIAALQDAGVPAFIARGAEEAMRLIEQHSHPREWQQ